MKNIITITIFAASLFLASCGGGGGGNGESSALSGDEPGSLVGGGGGGGGVAPTENTVPTPPAGLELSREGYIYSPSELGKENLPAEKGPFPVRIDKNGNIIGMYSVPFNPCKNKPCKEEAEAPETNRP